MRRAASRRAGRRPGPPAPARPGRRARPARSRPAPRRAAAVHDDHREALVGEPLAASGARRGRRRRAGRAGRRKGPSAPAAARARPRARTAAARAVCSARSPTARRLTRGASPGGSASEAITRGRRPPRCTVVVTPSASSACRVTTSVPPTSRPPCTPGSGVRHRAARRGRPGPQRGRRRLARDARNRTRVAVHVEHPADLQRRRRHRLAADEQPPGAVAVGDPHERARRGAARARRGRSRPSARRCPRARGAVAPVAGSTRRTRSARWSRGCTTISGVRASDHAACARYSSRSASQRHVGAGAVEADAAQRDPCVRRAGGGVGARPPARGRGWPGRRCATGAPGRRPPARPAATAPSGDHQ